MTDTDKRLCGRVDGAQVCAVECWRAAALGDRECPTIRGRHERGSAAWGAAAVLACFVAFVVTAVLLLSAWFDPADAAARKPGSGQGCRNAQHCKAPKPPRPTSTATPIAPGCVEYGPACVIDLTGSWPTQPPVVIVQHFPCSYEIPPTTEPCEPVTITETSAP